MSHNSKVPQVNQVQIEEENNVNVYKKVGVGKIMLTPSCLKNVQLLNLWKFPTFY